MINSTRQRLAYIACDFITTNVAILIFNICRFYIIPDITPAFYTLSGYLCSHDIMLGQLLFPPAMMMIYYLSGYYNIVFPKSRLQELGTTIATALIGTVGMFFIALINDMQTDRYFNYEIIIILYTSLFLPVYLARLCITRITTSKIHSRKLSFSTLIVGTSAKAMAFRRKLDNTRRPMGFQIVGFVAASPEEAEAVTDLPVYDIDNLESVCRDRQIDNLIIVTPQQSEDRTLDLINRLLPLDMPIYIHPNTLQLLTSRITQGNIAGEPLIDISRTEMSQSTLNCKRLSDIIISAITLIIISPIIAILAIAVKIDSRGAAFYKQTRIGYHKKPFDIYKLRSMHVDAENSGPALSAEEDPRITRIGRFLRKYRLDELPQFWNVLRGDMSLVGPRPEREYYIRKIMERAPYYTLVHRVRPGITSWGMVKYGYASSIDEMIERLRYDLIYIENISILVDIKIIIYTIHTVFTGKGI